jgi:predicted DCC family thiol-disulfide oxidoreductase YuxK
MKPFTFPVYVYYDRSCPLCRDEMQAIKARDSLDEIQLIDASADNFACEFAQLNKLTQAELMRVIYLRDSHGQWASGIDVFSLLYRHIGLTRIANFWAHPWLAPILSRLYPFIARWRQLLSKLGANYVYNAWIRHESARALLNSKRCQDDLCQR